MEQESDFRYSNGGVIAFSWMDFQPNSWVGMGYSDNTLRYLQRRCELMNVLRFTRYGYTRWDETRKETHDSLGVTVSESNMMRVITVSRKMEFGAWNDILWSEKRLNRQSREIWWRGNRLPGRAWNYIYEDSSSPTKWRKRPPLHQNPTESSSLKKIPIIW